jgi:hypothetical protein
MAILFKNRFAIIDETIEQVQKKQSPQSGAASTLILVEYQPWNIPLNILIKRIQEGKQEFPINVGTRNDVMERFANLVEYKPRIVKNRVFNSLACIFIDPNDYVKINNICDYYTGRTRAEYARRLGDLSPADYFRKNGADIVKLLDNKPTEESVSNLIYDKHLGIPNFKCTVFAALINLFDAKNIIDAATSWGDRLVASIAKRVAYEGYETDERFQIGYNQIIDDFCVQTSKKKYKVHKNLEDFRNGPKDADLAIMIPDCTIVSSDKWMTNIQNLIKIMCDRLISGGHLVLCIFEAQQLISHKLQKYITGPKESSGGQWCQVNTVAKDNQRRPGLGLKYQGVIRINKGSAQTYIVERSEFHVYKK